MEFTAKIKQFMNHNIVYTTEDERLADVLFKMSNAKTDIAVVQFKDTIVGVVTETDIFYALVKQVFSEISRPIEEIAVLDVRRGPATTQVMASCETHGWHPCVDTFEDDTIENAIRIMQRSGLHHLLVLDKKNKLVGTLSSHDIINSFSRNTTQIKKQ
jgi:CBS domain-containing protein